MLFKFGFKRAQQVRRNTPGVAGTWKDEKYAYSTDQYFTDLDKAKAYAQLHTPIPLGSAWELHDVGITTFWLATAGTQSDWLEFMITVEEASIDPIAPLPIPSESKLRFSNY